MRQCSILGPFITYLRVCVRNAHVPRSQAGKVDSSPLCNIIPYIFSAAYVLMIYCREGAWEYFIAMGKHHVSQSMLLSA